MSSDNSRKRKRYNAYRSSSDPLPPIRSRSRHLKSLSENILQDVNPRSSCQTDSQFGSKAFGLFLELENPDSLTLESFQNHSCSDSDSDSFADETTTCEEIFYTQSLEPNTKNILYASAEFGNDNMQDVEMTTDEDPHVFPSCPLRLSESVLLIMTLALQHKLAGEALADIIQLIDLHCVPSPQSRSIKTL